SYELEGFYYAIAKEGQVSQAATRPHVRQGVARVGPLVRRLRPEGAGVRLYHRPPDRGQPYRDDAVYQARGQGMAAHLPRQADHQEARRDTYGQGQGSSRPLGRGCPSG